MLRTIANKPNGSVRKILDKATIFVKRVHGHEYVSIAVEALNEYFFFTSGDVLNQCVGYTDPTLFNYELGKTDGFYHPQGYYLKVTATGASVVLTTKPQPPETEKPFPYTQFDKFGANPQTLPAKRAIGRYAVQVSGITEPMRFNAPDGRANQTVWEQSPCCAKDEGFDIIGNTIGQGGVSSAKHAAADTDWPRTITRCVRKDPNKVDVELIVIVTQSMEICVYRTEVCDGNGRFSSVYPQQYLNIREGDIDYVARAKIPMPAGAHGNRFTGEARAEFKRDPLEFHTKSHEHNVRMNSTSSRFCFTYDLSSVYTTFDTFDAGHCAEYELDIQIGMRPEDITLTITPYRTFTPAKDGFIVYACDYLMYAKDTLKKLFAEMDCETDDLILLKNPVTVTMGGLVKSTQNVFYMANETKKKNIIALPHWMQAQAVGLASGYADFTISHETHQYEGIGNIVFTEGVLLTAGGVATFPRGDDYVGGATYIESLELRSLSVAYSVVLSDYANIDENSDVPINEQTEHLEGYAVFVHGKKEFSNTDFDLIESRIMKRPRQNRDGFMGGVSQSSATGASGRVYTSMHPYLVEGRIGSTNRVSFPPPPEPLTPTPQIALAGGLPSFAIWGVRNGGKGSIAGVDMDDLDRVHNGRGYVGPWLDPTIIFITNPSGGWAYAGFYKQKSFFNEKMARIGGADGLYVFDQIVFYDKKGKRTATSHTKAFETASKLKFSSSFRFSDYSAVNNGMMFGSAQPYSKKNMNITHFTGQHTFSSFIVNFGLVQTGLVVTASYMRLNTAGVADSRFAIKVPILSANACFL